ncbi:hypothetical protein BN874_210030 [Candidatus Contendobacter odensis Run_B_J11]|uniref:Uncharacterized protein n=1 Tax=Candidatus Contendobacter odensis Run_B_J11 TaxID=1400861 RepID=A0A7U7J2K1_9GAMM|nr:hypothetical protein BN874_210030 [Candidatus Contendobacter odensis Run_B_J11]
MNKLPSLAAGGKSQGFRFPSFPRQRESSKPLKKLDTRFRGYDDFKGLGESPESCQG